ncbi:ABC transporter permease [Cypionkella sp.]|uniref:ABC transporter permease n=1 Tax=Cypionkella sp. TaxID=2811411 RepID=UPI00271C83AF|nr:hypothetical protein [Cypionkella sp.]MDO8983452.1 hypothetical protein [Cypionkella sp.]MDP1577272.1 hypothetical protein [Cypionkella sp.]MDP2050296.1 hypothetical protein [Cypionkella sp.]
MTRLGQVFLGMILIFLYTPIFVLMAMGFNESELYELPFKFSTRWYSALSTNTELLTSGFNSIVLAVITAIGTLAALALSRRTFRGRSLLQLLLLPPIAIPWLITGTAC